MLQDFFDAFSSSQPVSTSLENALAIQHFRSPGPAPEDQHQVTDIDDVREQLSDDDDRLALDQTVDQRQQASADREHPESDRHHAFACPLARDPLDQEAGAEGELRNQAEGKPEVEFGNEDIVQIVVECLPVLNQHYLT